MLSKQSAAGSQDAACRTSTLHDGTQESAGRVPKLTQEVAILMQTQGGKGIGVFYSRLELTTMAANETTVVGRQYPNQRAVGI